MNEDRTANIEARLAFQEDLIEELNSTVYKQQERMEQMEAAREALARHIATLAE